MSPDTGQDWDPGTYTRFRDLRLRPALDLLARIGAVPAGPVIDLGCGNGAVASALAERFPGHPLIGVDRSPAMLAEAGRTGAYTDVIETDIADWRPSEPPAVIYSNAALQWLDGHDALFPRLVDMLRPGGVLAVQMPHQFEAPSHALMRQEARAQFADRVTDPAAWHSPVHKVDDYARLLAPFGEADAWETTYVQRLAPAADAHPVRRFTEATAMRPFLAALTAAEAERFIARYEADLATAYPVEDDGSVLFPFKRLFFTVRRG